MISRLTYFPLAIVQAAAYINAIEIKIGDYLLLLSQQEVEVIQLLGEDFEDEGIYRGAKNPIATTWLISFEQIKLRDKLAAQYLSFMACIEPKEIPQSLLPKGKSRKQETDAIGTLTAYSFVTKRSNGDLDLHRLVHLATRNWLRNEQVHRQATENTTIRLNDVLPCRDEHDENRRLWQSYLPHVHHVLKANVADQHWIPRVELMRRYAACLFHDGRHEESEIWMTRVIDVRKRTLGSDHPATLETMINLTLVFIHRAKWEATEAISMQLLETLRNNPGQNHEVAVFSMRSLAGVYEKQGRCRLAV